jgi:hypothetical protein
MIGEFTVQNFLNTYRVSWQNGSVRHHYDMDLETLINNHIREHIRKAVMLIKLLDNEKADAILDNPEGYAVMQTLTDEECIPAFVFKTQSEYDEWRNKSFLKSYNKCFNSHLTYDMVQGML